MRRKQALPVVLVLSATGCALIPQALPIKPAELRTESVLRYPLSDILSDESLTKCLAQ
jgi:hypothetical protein